MGTLISAPGQTVSFQAVKREPVVAVDAERFAGLRNQLESDQWRGRGSRKSRERRSSGCNAETRRRQRNNAKTQRT